MNVSSTGRVGVKAGPVYVSGGGRRRRSSGNSGNSSAGAMLLVVVIAIAFVVFAVMWPLSLWGHAIHLTPSWHQLMHRDHIWMHEHYPLVGLRYLGAFALLVVVLVAVSLPFVNQASRSRAEQQRLATARAAERERQARERTAELARHTREQAAEQERQAQVAHERWLADPPPALLMPGRFTHTWIAQNAPYLHPRQIPILIDEMRRRGWTDADIEHRVQPYLPQVASPTS